MGPEGLAFESNSEAKSVVDDWSWGAEVSAAPERGTTPNSVKAPKQLLSVNLRRFDSQTAGR